MRQVDWRALSVHNGVLHGSLTSGARQASMRNVACGDKRGLVAVSLELIAHLDWEVGRRACDTHAEKECGDS